MRIGYARVSTTDQDCGLQLAALHAAGVERVYREARSGAAGVTRPELARMLDQLRPGDEVTVWKLDRLARSLRDLLSILDRIEGSGATLRSTSEPVDTGTPGGRMLIAMLGAVAEFERGVIRERCIAGLEAARARGEHIGRRPSMTMQQARHADELITSGQSTVGALSRYYGCHRATVKRAIHRARALGIAAP